MGAFDDIRAPQAPSDEQLDAERSRVGGLLAFGLLLQLAYEAREALRRNGIDVTVEYFTVRGLSFAMFPTHRKVALATFAVTSQGIAIDRYALRNLLAAGESAHEVWKVDPAVSLPELKSEASGLIHAASSLLARADPS